MSSQSSPTLSILFSESFRLLRHRKKGFLIGFLVFSLLTLSLQAVWGVYFYEKIESVFSNSSVTAGLALPIGSGNADDLRKFADDLLQASSGVGQFADAAKLQALQIFLMTAFATLFPWIVLLIILMSIAGFFAASYYFVLASLEKEAGIAKVFSKWTSMIVPFVTLGFWTSLRSFSWIPVVGPVFLVIYFPKFIASPALLLQEGCGVIDSVSQSMKLTRGHWLRITWQFTVMSIAAFMALWIVAMFAEPFGDTSPVLPVIVGGAGYQFLLAYCSAFLLLMGEGMLMQKKAE